MQLKFENPCVNTINNVDHNGKSTKEVSVYLGLSNTVNVILGIPSSNPKVLPFI